MEFSIKPQDRKSLSILRGQLLGGPGIKAENKVTSISRSHWNCSVFLLVDEIVMFKVWLGRTSLAHFGS